MFCLCSFLRAFLLFFKELPYYKMRLEAFLHLLKVLLDFTSNQFCIMSTNNLSIIVTQRATPFSYVIPVIKIDSVFLSLKSFWCAKKLGPSDFILPLHDQVKLAYSNGLDSYSKLTALMCQKMLYSKHCIIQIKFWNFKMKILWKSNEN